MNRKGYAIAFAVVLLAIGIGAFFGGRFLYQQLTGDIAGAQTWAPPENRTPTAVVAQVKDAATPVPTNTGTPDPRPLPTLSVILTPFVPPTPTLEPTIDPALLGLSAGTAQVTGTLTTTVVLTGTVTAPIAAPVPAAGEFVLASAVRNSTEDCSSTLILGRVVGRDGSPLAGVRLHLTDEFGAENSIKTTKTEAADLGRYDFPLFGSPRRYFLVVEDANGRQLSPRVEIDHGVGAQAAARCHWVDWKQK